MTKKAKVEENRRKPRSRLVCSGCGKCFLVEKEKATKDYGPSGKMPWTVLFCSLACKNNYEKAVDSFDPIPGVWDRVPDHIQSLWDNNPGSRSEIAKSLCGVDNYKKLPKIDWSKHYLKE